MSAVVDLASRLHEDDLVKPPRATRKAAFAVTLVIIGLPIVVLISPWRQNVASRGRVVAFDPVDRLQAIPAPVTGRVERTFVQEGARVERGQLLVKMSDLDPAYAERLEQQAEFARQKLTAARESAKSLERRIESLSSSRDFAIGAAEFELEGARQKVVGAEQSLIAAVAEREQKMADRVRKQRLFDKKLASELTLQKAVAAAESAVAKVEESEAKLEGARHDASAKVASIEKTRNELQAKIDEVASKLEDARGKVSAEEKTVQDALTKIGRQRTQAVVAPRAGVIFKLDAAQRTELVKKGETLLQLVPDTDRIAAEVWLKGNDAPLVTPGRPVRLQFEGWPAVQFVGWPSVARGTFGGIVSVVDSHDDGQGRFRILVEPDPDDVPWPDSRYLRQGVQVKGWVLLDEVSLGFEIWRQLNGFPPSLDSAPAGKSSKKSEDKKR